jgi:hypothetical protein
MQKPAKTFRESIRQKLQQVLRSFKANDQKIFLMGAELSGLLSEALTQKNRRGTRLLIPQVTS